MPHLIIEYSSNLHDAVSGDGGSGEDPGGGAQWLVDAVHGAALGSAIVPDAGLRTRAEPRSVYRVADGDPTNAFVAITARLGPGRTTEQKSAFLELILDTAEEAVTAAAPGLVVSYSIEYQEIDAQFRINRNHIRSRMGSTEETADGQ